jgi:hypothetical protein
MPDAFPMPAFHRLKYSLEGKIVRVTLPPGYLFRSGWEETGAPPHTSHVQEYRSAKVATAEAPRLLLIVAIRMLAADADQPAPYTGETYGWLPNVVKVEA